MPGALASAGSGWLLGFGAWTLGSPSPSPGSGQAAARSASLGRASRSAAKLRRTPAPSTPSEVLGPARPTHPSPCPRAALLLFWKPLVQPAPCPQKRGKIMWLFGMPF